MCTSSGIGGGLGGIVAQQIVKASPVAKILKKNDPTKSDTFNKVKKYAPGLGVAGGMASTLLNPSKDE